MMCNIIIYMQNWPLKTQLFVLVGLIIGKTVQIFGVRCKVLCMMKIRAVYVNWLNLEN